MLAAHSSLATSDERPWLGRLIRRIGADYPPAVAALDAAATAQLRQEYFDCVGADLGARVDGQRIVDKDPFNFVRLGLVRRIFPDAKIIFVNRDPRDVVLSCFMQWFQPNDATVHFSISIRQRVSTLTLWHFGMTSRWSSILIFLRSATKILLLIFCNYPGLIGPSVCM